MRSSPRSLSARKQQTIDAYGEALTAGAQFPPIPPRRHPGLSQRRLA
ncbi:hypothetical protein [Desulfotignum phosphitoxidans]|nr:hypothetical protein [Desulfotignum phosphitoxidans]